MHIRVIRSYIIHHIALSCPTSQYGYHHYQYIMAFISKCTSRTIGVVVLKVWWIFPFNSATERMWIVLSCSFTKDHTSCHTWSGQDFWKARQKVYVVQSTVEIFCSGKDTCQLLNKLVPHLVAKLHCLEGPHYQVLELANGTTAPDNFHQSKRYDLIITSWWLQPTS
jgi:hypothetical protein